MIIACPNCGQQYNVAFERLFDENEQSQQLQCYVCKHIWTHVNQGSFSFGDEIPVSQMQHHSHAQQAPNPTYSPSQERLAPKSEAIPSSHPQHFQQGHFPLPERPRYWYETLIYYHIDWIVFFIAFFLGLWILYYENSSLFNHLPGIKNLYSSLTNDIGSSPKPSLQISDINLEVIHQANQVGKKVLTVSGVISNPTSTPVVPPKLAVSVWGDCQDVGKIGYSSGKCMVKNWDFELASKSLSQGGSMPFITQHEYSGNQIAQGVNVQLIDFSS